MLKIKVILSLSIFLMIISPKPAMAENDLVWVDTSRWESQEVFVSDGYWQTVEKKIWVDASYEHTGGYWRVGEYKVWVPEDDYITHQGKAWVDTSGWVSTLSWVNEPYQVWVQKGHYVNVWVSSGYYKTVTKNIWISSGYWEYYYVWETREDPGWGINKIDPVHGSGGYAVLVKKKNWVNTSSWKTITEKVWVDTSHWQKRNVDTSGWETRYRMVRTVQRQWVSSGYWQDVTSQQKVSGGRWETRYGRHWVDTSQDISQGYWETIYVDEWVDTSRYIQQKKWIRDGYYSTPMRGMVIIEKDPRYVFTRWHKDKDGNEASMKLKISWRIDNSHNLEEEEDKEITMLKVYQDVVRYNDMGVDRVDIFSGKVNQSAEGSISTVTRFDHSGTEESTLYIYLYSQFGHVAYVKFQNPINGFISINLNDKNAASNREIWLGGSLYEILHF
jgi:hypothetical protein